MIEKWNDNTPPPFRGLPQGPTKLDLRDMLRQAVANTGGVPLGGGLPAPIPVTSKPLQIQHVTEEYIRIAVKAACQEMGCRPHDILPNGTKVVVSSMLAPHTISRARAYAAVALRIVFPMPTSISIARSVHAPSPRVYLLSLRNARKAGQMKWWDDAILARVVAALRGAEGG